MTKVVAPVDYYNSSLWTQYPLQNEFNTEKYRDLLSAEDKAVRHCRDVALRIGRNRRSGAVAELRREASAREDLDCLTTARPDARLVAVSYGVKSAPAEAKGACAALPPTVLHPLARQVGD